MTKKEHISETPAIQCLKARQADCTEYPYECLEHGGARHRAQVLGWDPYKVACNCWARNRCNARWQNRACLDTSSVVCRAP